MACGSVVGRSPRRELLSLKPAAGGRSPYAAASNKSTLCQSHNTRLTLTTTIFGGRKTLQPAADDRSMGRCTFGRLSGRDGCFADRGSERSFDEKPDKMWSGVRGHDGKGKSKDLWVKCYEAGVEQLGNHTSYRRNPFSTGCRLIWAPHCVIQSTTLGREGVS